ATVASKTIRRADKILRGAGAGLIDITSLSIGNLGGASCAPLRRRWKTSPYGVLSAGLKFGKVCRTLNKQRPVKYLGWGTASRYGCRRPSKTCLSRASSVGDRGEPPAIGCRDLRRAKVSKIRTPPIRRAAG